MMIVAAAAGGGGGGPGGDSDDDDFVIAEVNGYIVVGCISAIVLLAAAGGVMFVRKDRGSALREDVCPVCGGKGEYSDEYDDHYCWNCEEYFGDMWRKISDENGNVLSNVLS